MPSTTSAYPTIFVAMVHGPLNMQTYVIATRQIRHTAYCPTSTYHGPKHIHWIACFEDVEAALNVLKMLDV
ncbi:hypothetical protein E4U28_003654 [Claviceps purpurea]|nr:hypothetical protein E4U28_003654 [Claviceps purpurea]